MNDFNFDELDFRLNNPIYPDPATACAGLNPMDIFKAPDGHIYTPDEMSAIVSGNPCAGLNPLDIFKAPDGHIYTPDEISAMVGGGVAPNMPCATTDFSPIEIGQKSIDVDPNGGVIVTDIIGGKHHYSDMEQAMRCSDIMSGFPITEFNHTPSTPSVSDCGQCPNYPTDVHTPVDLSFYDGKLDDARAQLIEATKEIENSTDPDKIDNAIRKAEEARSSIRYWEDCRSRLDYDQTIDNIKSDKLINDTNRALNDLHNTLHHM